MSLAFLAGLVLALPLDAQDSSARARQLFVANCATCHGESGDGKGVTQLDRPARSFMDGGFSFGNTPEALFRTISTGIPGTPMPGFEASLSEEQRRLVAEYVVTLGPPIEAVEDEDMILVVHDRPLVVRGHLPPLAEGLPPHPRGLLIGDPSGITFEYRVDDVRLLALRQGGYVRRTDWSGRGGTPLEPLGKLVSQIDGGKPAPLFALGKGAIPLEARLSGTSVDGQRVVLAYHLVSAGREVAHVEESPAVITRKTGTGHARRFTLIAGPRPVHLALADATQPGSSRDSVTRNGKRGTHSAGAERGADEFSELVLEASHWSRTDGMLVIELEPGARASLELLRMPMSAWEESKNAVLGGGSR
ncbi:MAG: c-type cytochrome [Planctomycetes bacterium]|nr:c-type cytochrome [Planctomycetota bacterium]